MQSSSKMVKVWLWKNALQLYLQRLPGRRGEWAQSDPWNFTLVGSGVLGFEMSQAAWGGIAEAFVFPYLPTLLQR